MKYIISRYEHDMSWLSEYTDDFVVYDRSKEPWIHTTCCVPNVGSDWYDKLTYLIDYYDELPEVFMLLKANIFKYVTKEEFDAVKDNETFTPLLTQHHHTYEPICRYADGLYEELNNYWYLESHPCKNKQSREGLIDLFGIRDKAYLRFAPGSNYIVTRKVIHKYPKEMYVKIRAYLDWDVYPGEAQICERSMYNLWR